MASANLMLHCGAREVTRSELDAVPCPKPDGRWFPVPHGTTRYQEAICKAVSELSDFRRQEAERIRRMQQRIVSDHFAEAFLLRAYQDEGILSPQSLPVALKEWREPSFEDFGEKNLWRL